MKEERIERTRRKSRECGKERERERERKRKRVARTKEKGERHSRQNVKSPRQKVEMMNGDGRGRERLTSY